jgi:hypothetical protein
VNGLSVLGGSVAKGLGPVFAGILVASSVSITGKYASIFIFSVVGMFTLAVVVLIAVYLNEEEELLTSTNEMAEERIELVASSSKG